MCPLATVPPRPVYRREGGKALVEVRLREVRQLFHTLDPAPFIDKDLDEEAERYLVEAFREAGSAEPLQLVFHLPAEQLADPESSSLPDAIHNYFGYRARQVGSDLRQLLREGAASLAIGVSFLIACLAARDLVVRHWSTHETLAEGLLILGWVAMWRPVELLLYDWWPVVRRRALLVRISAAPVRVCAERGTRVTADGTGQGGRDVPLPDGEP
jgi:hypothetical protein